MTKQTDDKIAALEREIAALKKANAPPAYDAQAEARSVAEWRDQMHQARERAANAFQFRPGILREMQKACGDGDLADLVHASHRPQGPSAEAIPSSQTLTGVKPGGGAAVPGNGWRDATPLGPVAGVNHIDRIAAEFDRRDRAELAERFAKQKVAESKHDGR